MDGAVLSADTERDERRELEHAARDDRDAQREAAAERAYWADAGLEHAERVTLETWRWSR